MRVLPREDSTAPRGQFLDAEFFSKPFHRDDAAAREKLGGILCPNFAEAIPALMPFPLSFSRADIRLRPRRATPHCVGSQCVANSFGSVRVLTPWRNA